MPERPDVILIVTPGFPAHEQDHNCLPFHQALVKAMQAEVHPCQLVVLTLHYPFHRGAYDWHGVRVVALGGRNRGGFHRFMLERRGRRALEDLHLKYRVVAVLSCWYGQAAAIAHRYSLFHGIPHKVYLMGQDARDTNPYPAKLRLPGEALIAISDAVADRFLQDHGVKPLHRGYAAVHPSQVRSMKERLILAAGSLIPLKRFEWIIELARLTVDALPDHQWVIAGAGPERATLQQLISLYGLDDRVSLVGALPHAELLGLMSKAALFMHPSSYEGFPGVCLEALSVGTPVISVCRPVREPLPGWVYVDDFDEMRDALLPVLSNGACEVVLPNAFSISFAARQMIGCLLAGG